MKRIYIVLVSICIFFVACGNKKEGGTDAIEENKESKQLLQGVWIEEDNGDVVLRAEGDTMYFAERSVAPMYFYVVGDTLIMKGENAAKYVIKKLTANLFIFINQNSETVRVVKSDDKGYLKMFQGDSIITFNQQQLIKRDTVVYFNSDKYHCYIHVNPTTYKVRITSYNDDGIEIDKVYYDNILHVSVYQDARKIYSSNVVKQDFANLIDSVYLDRSILNDMSYEAIDAEGVHFHAHLGIPNSSSTFIVEYVITLEGDVIKRIKNGL